ncbi:hypothetical protein NQ318_016645, partial [Aromia moschata]
IISATNAYFSNFSVQVVLFQITKFAMYSEEQDSHGLLTLHYGKHHATIVDEIKTCFASENYADMTFICDDKTTLSAHKLIMASASPLVRRILGERPCAQPQRGTHPGNQELPPPPPLGLPLQRASLHKDDNNKVFFHFKGSFYHQGLRLNPEQVGIL